MIHRYRKSERFLVVFSFVIFIGIMSIFAKLYSTQVENKETFDQIQELKGIAKDIIYHDEVLTMSARVNILDKNEHWFNRYTKHADLLDETLLKAQSAKVPIEDLIDKLSETNDALISMEEKAFDLMNSNHQELAKEALFGEKYKLLKSHYSVLIGEIINRVLGVEQNLQNQYLDREVQTLYLFITLAIALMAVLVLEYFVRHIKEIQIEQLIHYDPLTSLLNRRSYDESLIQESNRCRREGRTLMLAILDVDNFKKYNDIYGHTAGDYALSRIGAALNKATRRSTEFAYRIGGEELAIISSVKEREESEDLIKNVLAKIYKLDIIHEGNQPYGKLTVSIGVACLSPKFDIPVEVIHSIADNALYDVKKSGRNNFKLIEL